MQGPQGNMQGPHGPELGAHDAWMGPQGPNSKGDPRGPHPTTTWAPQTARVLGGLEGQTRAQGLTGGTTSRADEDHRTLMEARSFTAEKMRPGDLDQDTREGATGEADTEEEGTEGTGAQRRGSAEGSSEDGEMTGSEEGGPADPELEATLTSTEARTRPSTAQRTWAEAGTTEAGGGHLVEEDPPEEEVTMVIETVSRCMMGRLQLVVNAPPLCRGWTWRLCPPETSVAGWTGTGDPRERESPGADGGKTWSVEELVMFSSHTFTQLTGTGGSLWAWPRPPP
ncbi:hypothetical protein INR49_026862 [Caranx melampygus]|nr:hypothetical protein INR49_026862 [Caranx melampygus]